MMGDYTEFLRIMSQNHENKRRKKNKKLKENNKKATSRLRRSRANDYTLAPLGYAGLYDPGTVAKDFDPNQPRDGEGKWTSGAGVSSAAHFAAMAAALLAEEEDDGPEMPHVDLHEPWNSISYGGRQVTQDDVEVLGGGMTSGLADSLVSKEESEAMSNYVAFDKDTLEINKRRIGKRLRTGKELDEDQESRNKILDSIANKAALSEDTDMWRGAVLNRDQLDSLVPGAVMTDPAYASASVSRGVAEFYAGERHSGAGDTVIFRVRGKAGDSVIPVRNNEWVIPRGTSLRVIKRSGNVVEVEYA